MSDRCFQPAAEREEGQPITTFIPGEGLNPPPPQAGGLSRRQNEVMALLCDGASVAEVAYRMGITSGTVKVHLKDIRTKLNAKNTIHAAAIWAAQVAVG